MRNKYRGKARDGEWVHGYLIEDCYIVGEVVEWEEDYFCTEFWVKVRPETVGQYTGLKDKNGTEIYDGDLLTDMDGDVFDVFYNAAHCAHMAEYVRTKHAEKKRGYFRLGDQCSLTIEVIGNVWENPELLK